MSEFEVRFRIADHPSFRGFRIVRADSAAAAEILTVRLSPGAFDIYVQQVPVSPTAAIPSSEELCA